MDEGAALFAGLDGGQSTTVAAIGNARETLARGVGPAADLVGRPRDSAAQRIALEAALEAALETAGLAPTTRFTAIVAGISGFDAGLSLPPDLSNRTERSRIVHDAEIAHAGALGGAAGILVIAGTGSVALGNGEPDGALVRTGGWGYFFGDEGSALWLARSAVRLAMLREDRGERSLLGERALDFFATPSLRALQHAVAHGEIERATVASFARSVLTAAERGDRDARDVRAAAAGALAELAATADRRLEPAALRIVSYAGGLFEDGAFVDAFGSALETALPHADLREPEADPAEGALRLARAAP